VLDPCCGTGDILRAVQAHHPGVECRGVEADPGLAEEASWFGAAVGDGLIADWDAFDLRVVNPPFSRRNWWAWAERARSCITGSSWLLLPLSVLEARAHLRMLIGARMILLPERVRFSSMGTPAWGSAWFGIGPDVGPHGADLVVGSRRAEWR
jgi:hypothetical protein